MQISIDKNGTQEIENESFDEKLLLIIKLANKVIGTIKSKERKPLRKIKIKHLKK